MQNPLEEIRNSHKGDLVDFTLGFLEGCVGSFKFAVTFNLRLPTGIRKRELGYHYGIQAPAVAAIFGAAATGAYYFTR